MRKFLIIGACVAGVVIVAAIGDPCKHSSSNPGHESSSHKSSSNPKHECCPKWLKDAKIEVTNIEEGTMVKFTSTDPAMVKKIQEFAPKLAECMKTGKCPLHEKATEEAKKVEKVKDPVCGMEINKESALRAEYEGKTYYFCSQQCKDSFLKEPSKYIEK